MGEKEVTGGVLERIRRLEAERRELAEKIRQYEEKEAVYRQFGDLSADPLYVLQDGRFQYVNRSFTDLFKIGYEEACGPALSFMTLVAPESRPLIEERIRKFPDEHPGASSYVFTAITRDGRQIRVENSVQYVPFRGGVAVLGILRDVTERSWLQECTHQAECRYQSLFENVPIGLFRTSPSGRIFDANLSLVQMFGFDSREALLNANIIDFYRDPEIRRRWQSAMHRREVLRDAEGQMCRADRSVIWVRSNARTVRDREGSVVYYEGSMEDITGVREAREALRASEDLYRTLFENAGAATLICGEDMGICLVNSEFERLFGFSREEVEGRKKWTEFVAPGDVERMADYHRLRRVSPGTAPRKYEFQALDREGAVKCVRVTVDVIPGTTKSVASLLDITDFRRAERELNVKSLNLEEINTALKVVLKQIESEKKGSEEKILSNVRELVFPYVEKMKKTRLDSQQKAHLSVIETNLENIIAPFLSNLSLRNAQLTATEIRIANLIKDGRTTKEIADLLNVSTTTVDFHRNHIREKLGLTNKKVSLRDHLLSLAE